MKTLLLVSLILAATNYGIAAEKLVAQDSIRTVVEEYETLEKVSDGKGGHSEFIQKRKKVKAIEFIDDKGQKIKEISIPETQIIDKTKKETKYVINPSKKFIAITNKIITPLTDEEQWNTGLWVKYNNEISYFNEKGDVVFQNKGVEYEPVVISENGNVIVCVKWAPDLLERVSSAVHKNPPKAQLLVFSQEGKLLLKKEESQIVPYRVYASPSGEWIFYEHGDFKLLNISSKKEISISWEKIAEKGGSVVTIMDDGGVQLRDYQGQESNGSRKFKMNLYYPETGVIKDLGVVYED